MRGFAVVFTPPVAYKGIAIACKRNTLTLALKEKITVHPNLMPATIFQMIATTKKTSLMRLQKDTIFVSTRSDP